MPAEEEEIVVKERKEQPRKKTKKKKKNAVKKVSTGEEIYALVDKLLTDQGPTMGMTEIANTIKVSFFNNVFCPSLNYRNAHKYC